MKVLQDLNASKVSIDPANSLVRVDGMILCKAFKRPCGIVLQFKDSDRIRSARCRGTAFVEIPLDAFIERLQRIVTKSD